MDNQATLDVNEFDEVQGADKFVNSMEEGAEVAFFTDSAEDDLLFQAVFSRC